MINGMIFNQLENSLSFDSLTQSKELKLTNSNIPTSYEIKENDKINHLNTPVRTMIHTPPIVISLPQPIEYNFGNQNNNY